MGDEVQNAPTAPQANQPRGRTALIIVDMIGDMRFAGSEAMMRDALAATRGIAILRAQADAGDVPVIFVNDTFGQWHSERARLGEQALDSGDDGRRMAEELKPARQDHFVTKPQFSGFYATNLPVLLPKLGVSRLVLTGIAADICILFTAADAHMRDYDLWVPKDTVAGTSPERTRWALELMRQSMSAEVRPTTELSLDAWLATLRDD